MDILQDKRNKHMVVLLLVMIISLSCKKEIWDTDIECLLTGWTNKRWICTDTAIASRIYYWSDPRKFTDKNGITGLWYLPISGIIREATFTDSGTIIREYNILSIDNNRFSKRLSDDSTAPVITYYAR